MATKPNPMNNAMLKRKAMKADAQQKIKTADSLANVRAMDKMKSDAKKTMSKK
jgi:hypothetical protein